MTRAIGIDLGTTYTVVAAVQDGRPTIVPNAEGQRLTPSVVCFAEGGEPLVGEPAERLAATLPDRSVLSIKRRMGSDQKVRIGEREYTPQEVSAMILQKVKTDAERVLGETIEQAVITVPAYFNDRQRHATKEAAALAGLEVLHIINEPTAAALAYGLDREDAHTILVWDLGGGTFDVSILELGEGIFEVRAVSGDSWLGGDDWDSRVAQHLMDEYRKACGTEFPSDPIALHGLRRLAEQAKKELSVLPVTRVRLPLVNGRDGASQEVEVNRQRFEEVTQDLLERLAAPTHQALADAGLKPEAIDRIILVGGATRMPAVRELARTIFGKEPYRYVQPDEVVAMGAAIQAGMLQGLIDKVVLLDVLPLSLGMETQGGLMAKIISRNTPVPASGSRIFTTAADYQTSVDLHVLQGERDLAFECVSLGCFEMKGIPSALRGVPKVEVTFEVDVDGIVQLSAQELLSGAEIRVQVASTKTLDSSEIEGLAEEALRNAAQDKHARRQAEARIEGENVIAAVEGALGARGLPAADSQGRHIRQTALELRQALESGHPDHITALSQTLRRELAVLIKGRPARHRG